MVAKVEWPPLSTDQQKLVEDNIKLAHKYAHNAIKKRLFPPCYNEDVRALCLYSLVRSASRWDANQAASFATFAWQGMFQTLHNHKYKNRNTFDNVSILQCYDATDKVDWLSKHSNDYEIIDVRDQLQFLKQYTDEKTWQILQDVVVHGESYRSLTTKYNLSRETIRKMAAAGIASMRHRRPIPRNQAIKEVVI